MTDKPEDVRTRTPEPDSGLSVSGKGRAGAVTVIIDDANGRRETTGPAEGEQ